ncbi:sensor histidine kinase [Algoriphagus terrigena]|uniref:sensor histidine kinase n=1 Tax=Algoriphagus terrigena TaxID=344884 RepID=UPI00042192F5|nr:sensor histidine kinase [Algoriphagus terrigena]
MAKQKYHFDITPHIVKQLGEQLVPDEVTALLELIKNSYDADASYVSIEINTSGEYTREKVFYPEQRGFIVVEDDGFGMDEKTIMKSWLLISYSSKRNQNGPKEKTPDGRTPLGEKGLGRLSTQRLANICEIFTTKLNEQGIHIAFNWKDFEKEEALSDVNVKYDSFDSKKKNGTTLLLTDLNNSEVWQGKNLEKFKGQILQVISPYKENRPFEVYLKVNGQSIELDKFNEGLSDLAISNFTFKIKKNILTISGKSRLAKFLGNDIDSKEAYHNFVEVDNGKKLYEYLQSKISDLKKSESPYFIEFKRDFDIDKDVKLEISNGGKANPGEFSGKINEFSYKEEQLKNENTIRGIFGKFESYRDFAQAQIGIKIYRNGFAVLPYGIDDNNKDWLGLSSSQTKTSFYDLRPDNVIGYVSIDEGRNYELKDKTDRSGLISNPYSRNFFSLIHFIKEQINLYQRSIRRNYNDFISTYKVENSGIKTASQAFKELKETKSKTEEVKDDFIKSKALVSNSIRALDNTSKIVKNDPLFTTELEKEAAHRIDSLTEELKAIENTLERLETVIARTERLNEVIDILEPKIQILEEQLTNFSELASLGLTAESVSHEFASIADRLAEKASFYATKLQSRKLTDSDVYVFIEYINTTVNGLKIQLKHLDPALKYNRDKKSSFKISDFFENERDYYDNRFEKQLIEFSVINDIDFSVTVNRGKLVQIIDNLLINSEYWLNERSKNEPKFGPSIIIKIEAPWIYISDNGYGVTPAIENQIFEPFVTTKPKGEGRGLGLFIIQQLLDSSGCTIALEPNRNEHNRKYIFAINLSNIIVS